MTRSNSSRARFLVAEARSNVLAGSVVALLVVIVAGLASGLLVSTTVRTAANALDRQSYLDASGRQVLRVLPTGREQVSAAFCESLGALDGVRSAFGLLHGPRARLANGVLTSTQAVTTGFAQYASAPAPLLEWDRWVYVGSSLALRAGVADAGWAHVIAGTQQGGSSVMRVRVLPPTVRNQEVDDTVVMMLPVAGAVAECRVDPEAASRTSIVIGIPALAPAGQPVVVQPLRPDIERNREPENQLADLAGSLLAYSTGALCGLCCLGWWYVRRVEWALYRSFGLGFSSLALLAVLEWAMVTGAPMAIGAAWGLAVARPGTSSSAYHLALWSLAIAIALSLSIVGIWVAYLRRSSTAQALRGM